MTRAAVFLDRDGVVNELVPDPHSRLAESPLSPAEVALMPGVSEALHHLRNAGFALIVVSNQPAAAKGTVPLEQLIAVHERVVELLREQGVIVDDYRYCFHHPDGSDPELGIACQCRKPSAGLLVAAAGQNDLDLTSSWMIGDTDSDAEAGLAAGCRVILVETPGSAHKRRNGGLLEPFAAPDLVVAADIVLSERTGEPAQNAG